MAAIALIVLLCLPFVQDRPATSPSAPASKEIDARYAVRVPTVANPSCPIMGKPISQKLFTDTPRGRIWICCKSCIKDIQTDVELAYRTAFPSARKLANEVCPLTGKKLREDSPRVELQGIEFSVLDADAAKLVADDSQAVLAKLLDKDLVDVANRTCPITNEAVGKNHVVRIGNQLVRISSPKVIESIEKEPRKALERAQAIRAEQDAKEAAEKAAADRAKAGGKGV